MAREKILLVDDEPAIRWTLRQALTAWGFETIEAGDLSSAIDVFEKQNPPAVLLDINLPDGSGLELLRLFKLQRPKTVVIIVSGEVIVENTIAALRGGADDFVVKPTDLKELRHALEMSLNASREEAGQAALTKPKVLIISDSTERTNRLKAMIGSAESEIEIAKNQEEIDQICVGAHEIAIIDLGAAQLREALAKLRTSEGHARTLVLVSLDRIADDPIVVGLLPQYRAMPCSPAELNLLLQSRLKSMAGTRGSKPLL